MYFTFTYDNMPGVQNTTKKNSAHRIFNVRIENRRH